MVGTGDGVRVRVGGGVVGVLDGAAVTARDGDGLTVIVGTVADVFEGDGVAVADGLTVTTSGREKPGVAGSSGVICLTVDDGCCVGWSVVVTDGWICDLRWAIRVAVRSAFSVAFRSGSQPNSILNPIPTSRQRHAPAIMAVMAHPAIHLDRRHRPARPNRGRFGGLRDGGETAGGGT